MNRVVSAARLYLISGQLVVVPWAIMISSLLINLAIFGSIQAKGGEQDDPSTGGLLSLYAVVMVSFMQAMNKQLAFALGFSLTRRTFLLGSVLFALGLSLASALALYALYGIEQATDGWWMNLTFFGVSGLGQGHPVLAVLAYTAPMVAFAAAGALFGGVSARWGTNGIYVCGLIGLVLGGAFTVIMTYAEAWPEFGDWFADQSTAALFAGYPWIITLVFGAGAYLVVRRVGV